MKHPERDQSIEFSEEQFSIPEIQFDPDPELVKRGWERRFTADPDQAEDTLRLYTQLGFEVRMEPIKPTELSAICGDCRLVTCRTYVTVYTRKPKTNINQNA